MTVWKVDELPPLPTVGILMEGFYQLRYRDISVFYSWSQPIAFQVGNGNPIVRKSHDPNSQPHYVGMHWPRRMRLPMHIFDSQFNDLIESRWAWGRVNGPTDAV